MKIPVPSTTAFVENLITGNPLTIVINEKNVERHNFRNAKIVEKNIDGEIPCINI